LPVTTIPKAISIGPKLLDNGDSHSLEQQPPLIRRSLHDQRQEIPLPSRLKLARMYYSAMTPPHRKDSENIGGGLAVTARLWQPPFTTTLPQ
jgi:hypothetical protein